MNCELCGRAVLQGDISEHHLVPKSKGGGQGPTAVMHSICHKQIHGLFGEKELAIMYNNINSLKAHRDVQRFIKWVSKKDPAFNIKVKIRRKNR